MNVAKSVMDGVTYHGSVRDPMGDEKKVLGTAGHYEEQESDGKRKKRKKAPAGGRRIVVGMKLATACREVLTWTIAKVAHPGDLVIALHVASIVPQTGTIPVIISIFKRLTFVSVYSCEIENDYNRDLASSNL